MRPQMFSNRYREVGRWHRKSLNRLELSETPWAREEVYRTSTSILAGSALAPLWSQ